MDCTTAIEKMDAFREGALSQDETSQVQQHIAGCERCRSTFDKIQEFDIDLRDVMRSMKPSNDFASRTASKAGGLDMKSTGVRPVIWLPMAAAACLVLAVVTGVLMTRGTGPGEPRATGNDVPDLTSTYPVGSAFVAKSTGSVLPYRGRTSVEVAWDFLEDAPALIVDAFPEGE